MSDVLSPTELRSLHAYWRAANCLYFLWTHGVVAGIGLQPNVDLAQAAGLTVSNGIVVDEFLRTNHSDIYAAGDVAAFYNPLLKERLRVEHEDNANTMGQLVGEIMAGEGDLACAKKEC